MNADTTLVRIHGVLEENSRRLYYRLSLALGTACQVVTTSLKAMLVLHAVVNPTPRETPIFCY